MIWKVPKLWEGGSCFIIGGGTSMPKEFNVPEDIIQKVYRGKLLPSSYSPYMKSIHNQHIIGINNAYQLGNWIDILFFGDSDWHLKHAQVLTSWKGLKVTCDGKFLNRPKGKMEGIKCLDRDKEHRYGISPDLTKVSWNANSGASAISLAAHLGVKKIFLLGFDMCLSEDHSHWHGSHLPPGQKMKRALPFGKHLRGFPQIAKDAKQMGIEIFNISSISKIEEFPKIKLEDAING